jgi:preprotein translocase subunit YajC
VGGAYFVIVLALVLGVMYVMMIRPQRRFQQEQRTRVAGADVGDDILTNGGIYGTIVAAEGDDIEVEIANGITVHMTRQGITAVLPPDEEDEEGEYQEDEPEEHEGHDEEEGVRERIANEG